MKHRTASTSSHLSKIRSAQERKRALITKLLARKGSDPSPATSQPMRPPDQTTEDSRPFRKELDPARIGLRLRADDTNVELHANRAIGLLAAELLQASESRESRVVLLWPGSLRALALAHAVATVARWHQGNKQGIRTLLYPAKSNFLSALNHAHVDRSDLLELARELFEDSNKPNSKVTHPFREKDAFWFSLNDLKPEVADRIHPSLAELLPHYFANKDFEGWRSCDGDLLRHIKANLRNHADRRVLNENAIRTLSNPDSAPDSIFTVSWKASRSDIRAALRDLEHAVKPDVLVLDLTRALRRDNPLWKSNAIMFLECFRRAYPEGTPPVLVVTDEPYVWPQLTKELRKSANKRGEVARWLLCSEPAVSGIVCTAARNGSGLTTVEDAEARIPSEKDIQVAITDTEAGRVIALLDHVREELLDPDWEHALEESAKYLARLAALPSSTHVLMMWLNETNVPEDVRRNFAWPVYRSKLEQILHHPAFKKRAPLKQAIHQGNELWENYANGTPMARKLAELIEEHTRGNERCCVAFTKPTARRLAERYFETYDGYPEGAGFEVLRDCVRFVVTRDLEGDFRRDNAETVIFAGLDEESLRYLLVEEGISSPTYVLLTRRNAAYLRATLRSINSIPGFEPLRSRVEAILGQLPDFPDLDERSIFNRTDFVLPTFSFEQGLSASLANSDDHDENAWEIVLDNGIHIRRSPQSTMYLYDPALSHTPSRGFRQIGVSRLMEGDRLFVMSVELREMTEAALKEAGAPISNDRGFENELRQYHDRIGEMVRNVPGSTLSEKARGISARMEESIAPGTQMPAEARIKSWMDVERFRGRPFDESRPGAPRDEAHFKAFAETIGLDTFEAVYFWRAVIQPLRGVRRADGRRVSDAYADLLLDPESAIVHKRLKYAVVQALFARAKESVHVVEAIRKPDKEPSYG